MDSHRLVFDSYSSHTSHMLFLGGAGSQIFRGARSVLGFEKGENKRRPFFTTAEELLEDEYYGEQLPEKKPRLTPEQVHILERSFEADNKLEPEKKSELAKKLGLQSRQIAVWFQNRRARWKTKQLERDFDRLKASYDALLADRDVLIKDNDRLSLQVISLTENLREKELAAVGLQSVEQLGADGEKAGAVRTEEQLSVLMLPKGKDMLSPKSGGSAVEDGDGAAMQAYCSGDSYFQETLIEGGLGCFVGAIDGGTGSEEDGCSSDDGRSYLPVGMFAEAAQEDNWWVWS